jgi:hypothetical protein
LADCENPSADWKAGDLKHLIASLLHAPLYRNLVDFVSQRRRARIESSLAGVIQR